jgi:hypothetical protein
VRALFGRRYAERIRPELEPALVALAGMSFAVQVRPTAVTAYAPPEVYDWPERLDNEAAARWVRGLLELADGSRAAPLTAASRAGRPPTARTGPRESLVADLLVGCALGLVDLVGVLVAGAVVHDVADALDRLVGELLHLLGCSSTAFSAFA